MEAISVQTDNEEEKTEEYFSTGAQGAGEISKSLNQNSHIRHLEMRFNPFHQEDKFRGTPSAPVVPAPATHG